MFSRRVFLQMVILCLTIGFGSVMGRNLTKVLVRAVPFWVDSSTSDSEITAVNDRLPQTQLFPVPMNPKNQRNHRFLSSGDEQAEKLPTNPLRGNMKQNWLYGHILIKFLHPQSKKNKEKPKYKINKDLRKRSLTSNYSTQTVARWKRAGKFGAARSRRGGNKPMIQVIRSGRAARTRRTGSDRVRRIVGGNHCAVDTWPWLVSIQYLGIDENWHHFCSGSLIDSQWIATVAHCVAELDELIIRVVLGDYQLSYPSHNEQGINPSKIYMNSYYEVGGTDYDIAMIKLSHPAVLTSHVQTIPMATKTEFINQRCTCYIAGWGNTIGTTEFLMYADYLQESAMSLLPKSECRQYYENTITDMHVCVKSDHSSACLGDSGGPLVCTRDDNSWALVGLASWVGSATCDPGIPSVYTRVGSVVEWIQAVMVNF